MSEDLSKHPQREQGVHTIGEQLEEVRQAFENLLGDVGDIAVMPGYTLKGLVANTIVGKLAVLNGIGIQDAENIGNTENFDTFITALRGFRSSWISRLAKVRESERRLPTREDVEWAFFAERLELDHQLAAPLRGLALQEFLKQRLEFTKSFLLLLNESVPLGEPSQTGNVTAAFDKTVEATWRKRHPINRQLVNVCQITGMVMMATSSIFMSWNKILGTILLLVGLGCNGFTMYLTKN